LSSFDEECELLRRRGAVCVDKGNEIGLTKTESLSDHTAFAQLGIDMNLHTWIFLRMAHDDLGCGVVAVVEGNDEPHVRVWEPPSVGMERGPDSMGLIVSGNDYVETDLIRRMRRRSF
jgi:hypothetical protein